jgi:nucleotide-binding universal stress UspA family protein
MMMPQRIKDPHVLENVLLATDFSPASDAGFPYAVQIARSVGAKIYIAHIVLPEIYVALPAEARDSAMAQVKAYAEQRMERLLNSPLLAGIAHKGLVRTGEVWVELATIVSEANIDLVITGTRGRRGITKMLLGSVAEEIFRLSPVPVLTVGPGAPPAPIAPALRFILHPCDFSVHSTRAAEYALRLAREFRSCIT